jgi:rubredoxin
MHKKQNNKTMTKFVCPCKYKYDPEKGDPKNGIPAGTPFEDLPDDWRCPRCKRKKEKFVPVEE